MTDKNTRGLKFYNENLNKVICESLQEALIFLMNKKPFLAISITELCQKAGVSRTAFYNNYKTKEDLLKKLVATHNKDLVEKIGSPFREFTGLSWYVKMFEYVKEKSFFLETIFNAGFKYEYLSIINDAVLHDPDIPPIKRYLRVIWAGGIVNTIIYWLDNKMKEPLDEIAKFCYDNLSVWSS